MADGRMHRRAFGVVKARLPEVGLDQVEDPRDPRGIRWPLSSLLTASVVGLCAGLKGLAQLEKLTEEMSVTARRKLGLAGRIPDTTLRDALVIVEPNEIRTRIHAQVKAAHKRKALAPYGLPFGGVTIDGKGTALPVSDWLYAQKQTGVKGKDSGVVRTLTCCLTSSRAKIGLDAVPIPAATNEMGHFQTCLDGVVDAYGRLQLIDVVTYDAGACSLDNATAVRGHKLDYLFRLNANQPTLYAEAKRALGHLTPEQAEAETRDVVGRHTVVRRLYLTTEMASFAEGEQSDISLIGSTYRPSSV